MQERKKDAVKTQCIAFSRNVELRLSDWKMYECEVQRAALEMIVRSEASVLLSVQDSQSSADIPA